MKSAFLANRGVVKISGEDARHFLNGLVTTDMTKLTPSQGRFGALLTPQGKIVADFFVTELPAADDGGFLLDCPRELAQPLADKLKFYKLRAKVLVENLSDRLGVLAIWDGELTTLPEACFADPRDPKLGWRCLLPVELANKTAEWIGAPLVDAVLYDARRISCGAPAGGVDFRYGDAFPHEANMDRLHGVDFDKGCYVGQEVVSRMQHRGTARTRTVRLGFDGAQPEPGSELLAADKPVGHLGSLADGVGLALVRIDRLAEAVEAASALSAGGVAVRLLDPVEAPKAPTRTLA
ncbi:YgfZ/GcvT domain-containing protein [Rhodopseudomonas palustris]|uniref:Glycine cleavage T protein (Aminomethyl transferase) n=1 Tax=Rhodopseudomonas palustris (strain BisB18) TaxID=316056 RepID=Q20YD2_RHOPB